MKKLRNIGIYYTLFGFLLLSSFVFTKLWQISILGILLILLYYILKIGFKRKEIKTKLTKQQLQLWDFFLILFPFFYVTITSWYVWRPYNQSIIVPKNYDGVIAIQYNKPDGQPKKWIGGFLGIGASRLIEVDSTGIAKTQFKFHNNAIPFLGLRQTYHNRGGLKIYYKNDLDNEIIKGADGKYATYEKNNGLGIFFSECRYQYSPIIVFTVTNKKKYNYFFMNEKEKDIWIQKKQENSNFYIEKPIHVFNEKFKYYNTL